MSNFIRVATLNTFNNIRSRFTAEQIVFIEETKQIFNNGIFYGGVSSNNSSTPSEDAINELIRNYVKKTEYNSKIQELETKTLDINNLLLQKADKDTVDNISNNYSSIENRIQTLENSSSNSGNQTSTVISELLNSKFDQITINSNDELVGVNSNKSLNTHLEIYNYLKNDLKELYFIENPNHYGYPFSSTLLEDNIILKAAFPYNEGKSNDKLMYQYIEYTISNHNVTVNKYIEKYIPYLDIKTNDSYEIISVEGLTQTEIEPFSSFDDYKYSIKQSTFNFVKINNNYYNLYENEFSKGYRIYLKQGANNIFIETFQINKVLDKFIISFNNNNFYGGNSSQSQEKKLIVDSLILELTQNNLTSIIDFIKGLNFEYDNSIIKIDNHTFKFSYEIEGLVIYTNDWYILEYELESNDLNIYEKGSKTNVFSINTSDGMGIPRRVLNVDTILNEDLKNPYINTNDNFRIFNIPLQLNILKIIPITSLENYRMKITQLDNKEEIKLLEYLNIEYGFFIKDNDNVSSAICKVINKNGVPVENLPEDLIQINSHLTVAKSYFETFDEHLTIPLYMNDNIEWYDVLDRNNDKIQFKITVYNKKDNNIYDEVILNAIFK